MPVSNKPSVTTFQVGQTVYFIENNIPRTDTVKESVSTVTDVNNDNTGEQVDLYKLTNQGNKIFESSELFSSKSAIKTDFDSDVDALP